MNLVNMKLDPKKREKMAEPATIASEGPAYPYGLSISLENDSLDKLGIDLPEVGAELTLTAKVKVTACRSEDNERRGKNRSVTLQITDLALDDGKKRKATEDVLYAKE